MHNDSKIKFSKFSEYQLLEFLSFLHDVTETYCLNVDLDDKLGKNLFLTFSVKMEQIWDFLLQFLWKTDSQNFDDFFYDGTAIEMFQDLNEFWGQILLSVSWIKNGQNRVFQLL